ncbi:MAG: NAD(P)-dependent oxidoreductase [Chroococcus sp. CMT-3BRIN-NPC107]|jgi:3-hydroxyisobutyrate dehydrogenase|nr:NAD(P)-dependent oxidoreductase [Chroococcus sp. CMT-3BRIN-NPC107]
MRVGFIGIGLMGLPMAQKLVEAGIELVAYNRTPEKLEPLGGVKIAQQPADAIIGSDCIMLMLTNASAICSLLLSEDAKPHLAGKTVIQMSTIAPNESMAIAQEVIAAGGEYLEAPVLGSIPEAQSGKLIVMVGGTEAHFERWRDLLQNFGTEILLIGEVGSASAIKLALNQLIASLSTAFALSLGFLERQGASVDIFMQILRQSALYAPTFDKKLPRMRDRNYSHPNFPTKHLLKDTELFINAAQGEGMNISSIEGVKKILEIAITSGFADADYSSLFSAIARDIS